MIGHSCNNEKKEWDWAYLVAKIWMKNTEFADNTRDSHYLIGLAQKKSIDVQIKQGARELTNVSYHSDISSCTRSDRELAR